MKFWKTEKHSWNKDSKIRVIIFSHQDEKKPEIKLLSIIKVLEILKSIEELQNMKKKKEY
jgi:hypothetical protein